MRGGSKETAFDVRALAATNQEPMRSIAEGRLREDLFYRLSVFSIALPPLRGRPDDIPLLTQHFLHQFNAKHGTYRLLSDPLPLCPLSVGATGRGREDNSRPQGQTL